MLASRPWTMFAWLDRTPQAACERENRALLPGFVGTSVLVWQLQWLKDVVFAAGLAYFINSRLARCTFRAPPDANGWRFQTTHAVQHAP